MDGIRQRIFVGGKEKSIGTMLSPLIKGES